MIVSLRYISFNFLCAVLLLMVSSMLYGQQHKLKLYNVNDGLPGTEIEGAYQDKYGYLWSNSCAGLSRFDGRQFVNYGLEDGLQSLCIQVIFQDSRERLWVGTGAGMVQFKNNRFITYPVSDNLDIKGVLNYVETKDKRIWACTAKGVYEFEGNQLEKNITLQGL